MDVPINPPDAVAGDPAGDAPLTDALPPPPDGARVQQPPDNAIYCCEGACRPGGGEACVVASDGIGVCEPGGGPPPAFYCDDPTDCTAGQICCGSVGGSACSSSCGMPSLPMCRDDGDCPGTNVCCPLSFHGYPYAVCKTAC
jgi:hypothetical protein